MVRYRTGEEARKYDLLKNIVMPASGAFGAVSVVSGWRMLLASNDQPEEKRTVQVGRRRRSEPPGPEGRDRAEAPQRRRPGDQGRPPSSPGGAGGSGGAGGAGPFRPSTGGQLPGGLPRSPWMIGLIVVIFICVLVFMMFQNGQEPEVGVLPPVETLAPILPEATEAPLEPVSPTSAPTVPEATPAIPPPAPGSAGQASWLVMLYQDADDKILEQDIYVDLNEAERVGSSDQVHIVAQLDRYQAGYQGDGDWASARRYYVTRDNDLNRVGSQQVADLGEVNMADGQTLVDFVTWAIQTYPADRQMLILSDHGMGWPGGWTDPTAPGRGDSSVPLSSVVGDQLYLMELDEALGQIRSQTGLDKLELIGMDACLMSHLEVYSVLAAHARYAVASQETEPALGWAYTGFLGDLQSNPNIDGAELSRLIVDSYIEEDQRIVDDQARAEFVGRGSIFGGMFGGPTAEQLTNQLTQNMTLTAFDLTALPDLLNSLNDLAFGLQQVDQRAVAQARSYAQSFTSIFGSNVPPSYLDLGNFVQLISRASGDEQTSAAVQEVLAALEKAVIAEKHGPNKPGATGVSIYFPNSQLYQSPAAGPPSYTSVASRFASESVWDDFLAFHYTGRSFQPGTNVIAVPERGETISPPAAGGINISPLTLSDQVVAPGELILLSADISGENIGYIKLFLGFIDQATNSVFVADMDYLESADTREIDGVYYPEWGEGEFTLEFEWEPIVYAISDGTTSAVALLTPESYGAAPEDAVYTVDGIFTYVDGGESRYARLYLRDGVLRQVFGFTGEDGTGAPREIVPQPGDRFTVLEQWMDMGQAGGEVEMATQEGDTLTFGDQPFEWQELDAAAGEYIVGFIVEDLDGKSYSTYGQVRVE